MRTRKKMWSENELQTNQYITRDSKSFKGKWKEEYFKNDKPIHIEIGSGKGNFITGMSKRETDINFIGMERAAQIIVSAAKKVRESVESNEYIGNIGFILGDASNLNEYFESGEVERIYLNFSDPWPNKKKWAKRRLTYRAFLDMYKSILVENGELHFKTDNMELFEFSLNEFANEKWQMKNISLNLHQSDFHTTGQNIMTEYEQKFSSKGMAIYRLEASPKN